MQKMTDRYFAAKVNLKYNKINSILEMAELFAHRVFIEKKWGHLNECQAYNVDLTVNKLVDDKNALFMNRFNKYPDRKDAPEWDYFGLRGKPLFDLLPEWKEKVELFNDLGLVQLTDSPCILVTNRSVTIHRDGRPDEVPGFSNRHCGINYLLMNNSDYKTGVWSETDDTRMNKMIGLELTKPDALIEYDRDSMNMVNTALPHGSFIDPTAKTPAEYAPRAFITMGFTCSYKEAREKISKYIIKDW